MLSQREILSSWKSYPAGNKGLDFTAGCTLPTLTLRKPIVHCSHLPITMLRRDKRLRLLRGQPSLYEKLRATNAADSGHYEG